MAWWDIYNWTSHHKIRKHCSALGCMISEIERYYATLKQTKVNSHKHKLPIKLVHSWPGWNRINKVLKCTSQYNTTSTCKLATHWQWKHRHLMYHALEVKLYLQGRWGKKLIRKIIFWFDLWSQQTTHPSICRPTHVQIPGHIKQIQKYIRNGCDTEFTTIAFYIRSHT